MLGIASGGSEEAREAWISWRVVPARNVAVCFSLSICVSHINVFISHPPRIAKLRQRPRQGDI